MVIYIYIYLSIYLSYLNQIWEKQLMCVIVCVCHVSIPSYHTKGSTVHIRAQSWGCAERFETFVGLASLWILEMPIEIAHDRTYHPWTVAVIRLPTLLWQERWRRKGRWYEKLKEKWMKHGQGKCILWALLKSHHRLSPHGSIWSDNCWTGECGL